MVQPFFGATHTVLLIAGRYVQQQLFDNMQQRLCTSSVGHGVIASSIFSQLVRPPSRICTAYNFRVVVRIRHCFFVFGGEQSLKSRAEEPGLPSR